MRRAAETMVCREPACKRREVVAVFSGEGMALSRRLIVASFLIALIATPQAGRAHTQTVSASPAQLLDYYATGRFEEVGRALRDRHLKSRAGILDALRHDAKAWIGAGGTDQRNRRRMIAATLALDAADACFPREELDVRLPPGSTSIDLIAWGRSVLADGPPSDVERRWYVAAIAVLERGHRRGALDVHLAAMKKRFPDDPNLALGRAFLSEIDFWDEHAETGGTWGSADPRRAMNALQPALSRPETRDDAALRLGFFALYANRPSDAAAYLELIATSSDVWRTYLAGLFSGWAYERLQRPYDAIREYRIALGAVPRARTATMYFAGCLYSADAREEASAIASDAMHGKLEALDDPWYRYPTGDAHRFPMLLTQIQETLR